MPRTERPPQEVTPPDAVIVNRRWIPMDMVEWTQKADRIMLEHGAVSGSVRRTRDSARWHAQKLIRYMVDLHLHERWELSEHTDRKGDGWIWSVEYLGKDRSNGR
jgi:hypothetical protein